EPGAEAFGLRQIDDAVAGIVLGIGAAQQAALADVAGIDCLAVAAEPYLDRWSQWIGHLDRHRSLALVLDDADRRVDDALLDGLGPRRELTDGDVQLTVNGVFRWPGMSGRRSMVKQPDARGKSEHGQEAGVGQKLG